MRPSTPDSSPNDALGLSEIRTVVALYLNRKDCSSCMLVASDWFHDFVPSVWHTIDFDKDFTAFSGLTLHIFAKYGGFISQVANISSIEHLKALQHSAIGSLKSIKVCFRNQGLEFQLLADTIRRSQGALISLDITTPPMHEKPPPAWKNLFNYMYLMDAISSPPPPLEDGTWARCASSLRSIKFDHISITRESFSSFLQRCSSLQELSLSNVQLSSHAASLTLFAGSKLRCLVASLVQVWELDPNDSLAPTLLAHFPLLQKWHITSLTQPSRVSAEMILRDIAKCRSLKDIRFSQGDSKTTSNLISHVLDGLISCTLSIQLLASTTIPGLVSHLNTLTSITITGNNTTETTATIIQDASTTKWLQLIPRLCLHLQLLSFEPVVYDIEVIEARQWTCLNLRELRVRFKDLDTLQQIDRCVKQVRFWRQEASASLTQPWDTDTIPIRVAQYMLKFKRLRIV
ncbi:hypothetical protein BGX24_010113 [Mortierella sp. AD032]|nr:hypothetical protein BGX24_010113 [Mortierella sp. AD032]